MNKFQSAGRVKMIKGSILNPENAGLRFVLSINNMSGKPDNHPLYSLFEKKSIPIDDSMYIRDVLRALKKSIPYSNFDSVYILLYETFIGGWIS